jgi:hypothetical protein
MDLLEVHLEVVRPLEDLPALRAGVGHEPALVLVSHVSEQRALEVEAAVAGLAAKFLYAFVRLVEGKDVVRVRDPLEALPAGSVSRGGRGDGELQGHLRGLVLLSACRRGWVVLLQPLPSCRHCMRRCHRCRLLLLLLPPQQAGGVCNRERETQSGGVFFAIFAGLVALILFCTLLALLCVDQRSFKSFDLRERKEFEG